MARTLKLTIAYDGTDFAGWQRQATGRTVQATIEEALAPLEGGRVALIGAGRTDAGVHAAGQVASVALWSARAETDLQRALNATLPPDVRILHAERAPGEFNARFDARRKTYRYWIWSGPLVPPQLRRYVWHVAAPLDAGAMREAAAAVRGAHDFAAFQAAGSDVKTTGRELFGSEVTLVPVAPTGPVAVLPPGFVPSACGELLLYEVCGSGFLRHMVRNLAGTLVDVGRGRRAAGEIRSILASRDRATASATAPAHGLVLWSVSY